MPTPGRLPNRKPKVRKLSVRGISFAIDGKERPFPVYRFSRRPFFERPGHKPFTGL